MQSTDMRLKRLLQSGSGSETEIKQAEEKRRHCKYCWIHTKLMHESQKCYNEALTRCKESRSKIVELERQPDFETNRELMSLKDSFVLVLCADYQQSKLVPYWGHSHQPAVTYYLQKMSYDIFGIIDARDDHGYVYIAPENIGPKNTDHTMSYIMHFLTKSGAVPAWIKHFHIFMDNAGSTNKNYFMAAFYQELVQQKTCSFFRLSFMIAGHPKKFCGQAIL